MYIVNRFRTYELCFLVLKLYFGFVASLTNIFRFKSMADA